MSAHAHDLLTLAGHEGDRARVLLAVASSAQPSTHHPLEFRQG